jgi:hypothetical protein
MSVEQFGDVQIFRPSPQTEAAIRLHARAHLFARFAPGDYRGGESANAVIQHQFQFYDRILQPLIRKIACRDAAEFLLFQFDQAGRLLHGRGILDLRERERWMWIEPVFKRAIKYLVELICVQLSRSRPVVMNHNEALVAMETALVCTESLVSLAEHSELVYSIFPDYCVVSVYDDGPIDYEIRIEGKNQSYDQEFSDRVVRDRESRHRFVDFPQFDNQTSRHQDYLDHAFSESFGMSYGLFIACIMSVINDSSPSLHPNAFPTLFVHRGHVIDELAKFGRSRSAIERAIDGFSVTTERLLAERRVVWKPKQEARAYRRAFFVLPHETGPHLAFSREMARENLMQLVTWATYKQLPVEWKTSVTCKALENLSSTASKWFEHVVSRNLKSLGIVGQRRRTTIGRVGQLIQIPDSVGELDFVGYHLQERLVVLIESKMVMSGLEPCNWRHDLDRFVLDRGAYAERFRRKLSWIKENFPAVAGAVGCPSAKKVGAAMLTLYPCIAGTFINDFPCVSVTEFMLDYERRSHWPYQLI